MVQDRSDDLVAGRVSAANREGMEARLTWYDEKRNNRWFEKTLVQESDGNMRRDGWWPITEIPLDGVGRWM